MNPAIRPLLTEAASQRTETGALLESSEESLEFGAMLEAHLGEGRREPADGDAPEEPNPWAVLGAAALLMPAAPPVLAPPPMKIPAPVTPVTLPRLEMQGTLAAAPMIEGAPRPEAIRTSGTAALAPAQLGTAESPLEPEKEVPRPDRPPGISPQPVLAAGLVLSRIAAPSRIELTAAGQSLPPAPTLPEAELAGIGQIQGEMSGGTTAAKEPPMLLPTEMQEEMGSPGQPGRIHRFESERAGTENSGSAVLMPRKRSDDLHPRASEKTPELREAAAAALRAELPAAVVETERPGPVRPAPVLESIREQAQILRSSRHNELNVVVRPDMHTEISLQVSKVDGQIRVQARCERGDFTRLDAQWSAVQQALGAQGVRVEPLQAPARVPESSAPSLAADPDSSGHGRRESPPSFVAEPDLPPTRKPTARSMPRATHARGWQSWA